MDPKELRGLYEAYQDVYQVDEATAMAKRGLDEPAIRTKIAQSTGGGKSADRATALANTNTYGASGTDSKARQRLAATQRGNFRDTTSSNPGLHGSGHQSNDPAVKAKQAARGAQRGVLTPNEKKTLNREEHEIGEAVKGVDSETRRAAAADRRAGKGPLSAKRGRQNADKMQRDINFYDKLTKNEEVDIFDMVLEYLYVEGYAETLEDAEWLMSNIIDEEAIAIIVGEEKLDEIMKFQQEKDAIERRKKMRGYEPPTKGPHAEKKAPTRLRSGSLPEDYVNEAQEARNDPDAYERKQTGMNNPNTGINSKAFLDFYAAQTAPKSKKKETQKEDFEAWLDEAMSSYDKNRKRAAARAEERNRQREAGTLGGRMERISLRDKFGDAAGTRMGKAKPPGPGEKY